MKTQSAKSKGRRLQQQVAKDITESLLLEADDARSTSMGAAGSDVLLSPKAQKDFPFYVECKNQESLNVWSAIAQAEAGSVGSGLHPLVVFKRNRSSAYACLSWDDFLWLNGEVKRLKTLVDSLERKI
jgi:hypothetical protein